MCFSSFKLCTFKLQFTVILFILISAVCGDHGLCDQTPENGAETRLGPKTREADLAEITRGAVRPTKSCTTTKDCEGSCLPSQYPCCQIGKENTCSCLEKQDDFCPDILYSTSMQVNVKDSVNGVGSGNDIALFGQLVGNVCGNGVMLDSSSGTKTPSSNYMKYKIDGDRLIVEMATSSPNLDSKTVVTTYVVSVTGLGQIVKAFLDGLTTNQLIKFLDKDTVQEIGKRYFENEQKVF